MQSGSSRAHDYDDQKTSIFHTTSVWKNRPDSEHEQALIRLGVGFIALIYLILTIYRDGQLSSNDLNTLTTAGLFFISALFIILWLIRYPGKQVWRRILGVITDNCAITSVLYFHGTLGAPLFIIYLWVAFGNGFRFGRPYLALSASLATCGFAVVAMVSEGLQSTPYVTGGLLVGLIVLPCYVATLLRTLHETLELAESANQAKSTFLATMSHEIRTPLNGLVGITEMLRKTKLDKKQKHYLELISKSSEWLMRVITDGLDFSKIESGEFLLMKERFDLIRCLQNLSSIYSSAHGTKDVLFIPKIPDNLPRFVFGDQLRLTQVLGNLLANAFKFTKKGYVAIYIEVISGDTEGSNILFTVEDTGIGIREDEQEYIFEPFKQATEGMQIKQGGTGLGLAIAERLVDLMGGSLKLSSEVDIGSKFYFSLYFPFAKLDDEEEMYEEQVVDTLQWRRAPQILLVEDHEINREVINNQLIDLGCQICHASNGREAISKVENNNFDCILMDCQMPVLDGYNATRKIRSYEKKEQFKSRTPIIALTAHVTVEDRRKCLKSGMDDYLGKPFKTEMLKAKLVNWLGDLLLCGGSSYLEPLEKPDFIHLPESVLSDEEEKLIHDLKNTLFIIQASAEMTLHKTARQDDLATNAARIQAAIDRAVQLIDALSDELSED